jgi:NAD-dependent dihydropyrimidine dehydrogenase PreA subunit
MPKNPCEALCDYYELIFGPLPWRDEFVETLKETVRTEDLELFFHLPLLKGISHRKLVRKARMAADRFEATVERLANEGMIMVYTKDGERTYERGNPVYMTEQQVRKPEDTPRRRFYARFFNTILNGEVSIDAPSKTPFYRVLPLEATVTGEASQGTGRFIPVGVDVPDPRAVLPIDVVSEMIRRDARLIGLADCYCRRTKQLLDEGCDQPLQTCLVFNKGAEALINHGTAREISLEEALEVVRISEELGLVHNVDNAQGEIGSICNCCPCCSILLTTWNRGMTNADSPSRYRVAFSADRCQLCKQCVTICPTSTRQVVDGRVCTQKLWEITGQEKPPEVC